MWQEKDKQLYRLFEFKDFKEAFGFMEKVAEVAEKQKHHPKIQNDYNKVEIWLMSHDAGTVTDKDHKLAQSIDDLFKAKKSAKNKNLDEAKLYTDGGSRGNPGPSAGAYVICKMDNTVVETTGLYLGETTNNQAEYRALKLGLEKCLEAGVSKLVTHLDSELVVKQLNGQYKIKNQELLPRNAEIKDLAAKFEEISFNYVPRALNHLADAEVNRILDEQARS